MVKKDSQKYIPGLACFKFKPKDYWDNKKAEKLYETSHHGIDSDSINFSDCISGMEKMPENCVDLVIADPPFGIKFSGKEGAYNRNTNLVMDSYHEIDNNYEEFTKKWLKLLYKIMKPCATAYVFSGWNHLEDILHAARISGLTTINHIIWKYQFGVFTQKKFVTSHYHILMLVKEPNSYYFNKMEHYPLDVWEIKRKYLKGEEKNATTLPFDLVRKCVEFSSKPGDIVFDPFMGMATTAIVSKSLYRHYYGFEINEKMKPVINKRIKLTIIGDSFISLEERLSEIQEEARKKYPLAYKHYIKEVEEIHV